MQRKFLERLFILTTPLRLTYLAPEVLKRLTCSHEAASVTLYDLCFLAGKDWGEQFERVFD
jgi:hypothetical protein